LNLTKQAKGSTVSPLSVCNAEGGEAELPLPCLNCNNTDEKDNFESLLSPYYKKSAFCLRTNCGKFIDDVGIDNVGFLTLTFPDNVLDNKEAYRRFCNMRKQFLSIFFGSWMLVKERQKRGAWHYHILIDCKTDIRSGINWDEIHPPDGQRAKYSSASNELRNLWSILRDRLPIYGFGRSELLPIRSNAEATSKYVGKYIAKHIYGRSDQDKGVRLTSYSQKAQKAATPNFQWNSPGAKTWRSNLARWGQVCQIPDITDMQNHYGHRWAFKLSGIICKLEELCDAEILYLHQRNLTEEKLSEYNVSQFFKPLPFVLPSGDLIDPHSGEILF